MWTIRDCYPKYVFLHNGILFVSFIVDESGEFREVLLSLRYATHCLREIVNLFYELAYHLYLLMFVQIAGSQRTADQALPSCIFQVCAMLIKHNIVCSVYDLENVITDFIWIGIIERVRRVQIGVELYNIEMENCQSRQCMIADMIGQNEWNC